MDEAEIREARKILRGDYYYVDERGNDNDLVGTEENVPIRAA